MLLISYKSKLLFFFRRAKLHFLHAVKCCGNLHLISFSILTLNPHSLNTFTPLRRSFALFKTFRGQKISWRKKKIPLLSSHDFIPLPAVVTISFPSGKCAFVMRIEIKTKLHSVELTQFSRRGSKFNFSFHPKKDISTATKWKGMRLRVKRIFCLLTVWKLSMPLSSPS